MRILQLIIVFSSCLISGHSLAQTEQKPSAKYRHFAIYGGIGPSYFFNNLVTGKNYVKSFQYAFSARFMWEPRNSILSLGFETGYYRLYSVDAPPPINANIVNTSVPLLFVVSMKFSPKIYADWSMGQSLQYNNVSVPNNPHDFNNHILSLSDFSATVGYRFIQKARISYAAEFKGYYSSLYANGTIAVLFTVGYRL